MKNLGQTGEICLELLQSAWTPVYTLASTLEAVHHLLRYPDVDSPLNVDVAVLIRTGDRVAAEGLVRYYCWEWRWEGDGDGREERKGDERDGREERKGDEREKKKDERERKRDEGEGRREGEWRRERRDEWGRESKGDALRDEGRKDKEKGKGKERV
jgi:hypothetical protein